MCAYMLEHASVGVHVYMHMCVEHAYLGTCMCVHVCAYMLEHASVGVHACVCTCWNMHL